MASYNIQLRIAEEPKGITWYPLTSGENRAQLYIPTHDKHLLLPKWSGFHLSKSKYSSEKSYYTFLDYATQDTIAMIESAVEEAMETAPAWCHNYNIRHISKESLTPKVRLGILELYEKKGDASYPIDVESRDITTLREKGEELSQFSLLHVNGFFFNTTTKEYNVTLQLRVLIFEKTPIQADYGFRSFLSTFNIKSSSSGGGTPSPLPLDPVAASATLSGVEEEVEKKQLRQSLHATRSKSGILKHVKAFKKRHSTTPRLIQWAEELERVAMDKLEEREKEKKKQAVTLSESAAIFDMDFSDTEM